MCVLSACMWDFEYIHIKFCMLEIEYIHIKQFICCMYVYVFDIHTYTIECYICSLSDCISELEYMHIKQFICCTYVYVCHYNIKFFI